MITFRSLLLASAALAVMALPVAVPAQQAGRGHAHAGFARMVRSLDLSSTQRSQIQTMLTQYRAAHPKGSAPDPQARKALREQLTSVLTPQQKEKLHNEIRKARETRREAKVDRMAPSPSPSPVSEETAQP